MRLLKKYTHGNTAGRPDRYPLIIFSLWLIVQAAILAINGIKTDQEASRIINLAETFTKNGSFWAQNYYLYLTEIILVIIKIKLHADYWLIVAVQLILNLTALGCFYNFLLAYLSSSKLAAIGCGLLVLYIPYQNYNSYIYTESVFFSLSVIYSSLLLQTRQFTAKRTILLLLLLLLLCVTRPTGIFFLAATALFIYFKLKQRLPPAVRVVIPVLAVLVCLILANHFIKGNSGFDVVGPFQEEHVICGVTTLDIVPAKVMATDNSLQKLGNYLLGHKQQFVRLALLRSKAFWGLTRDYYSFFHNGGLVVFYYPLYLLILGGIIKYRGRPGVETLYLLSVCFIYWLSVIFTCDDWGNRFFFTLTPFLISSGLLFFKKQNSPTSVTS